MNLDFFFDGLASALSFFYDLSGSYAGAIVLLTLGVMVLVTPLTLKGTRSMVAMQQLQPELRKLQAKYGDDRQKLNEEMMAFYKEHSINPVGGCLPLLVQAPVFMVLYQVLIGLTRQHPFGLDLGTSAALLIRDPDSGGKFEAFGTFDPKYLDHSTNLYQDLAASRHMDGFGLDLSDTFLRRLSEGGITHAFPYLVLVLIVGVTAWYQQRQIMARNSGNQSQINPQQQMLMKVMPFFLPFFSLTLPAGIVLYFVVSNLYRIGQQAFITRTMYSDSAKAAREQAAKDRKSNPEAAPKKRGLLAELMQGPASAAPSPESSAKKGAGSKSDSTKAGVDTTKTSTKKAPVSTGSSAKSTGGSRPSRSAPSRTTQPGQNRSKKKKKRR